ncbi:MAG: 4-hydroxy-tetrahydrodipicolinate synthase, partial [Elusimicrobia bacterium]|nr:4-hydroxy-tetrahydrodipicolinate synthase [Elusimicrobiota bacterium]
MFKGSLVALITPFKEGRVDDRKLQELVEWHISERTNGLVPMGTTGESATLSYEEHYHVIDVVVKQARKRVPVIAGAGSNSTHEAIDLTKESARLGADAVLSVNPYYNKPTQEGLFAHFTAIAKASPVPVVLYNIPSRSSVQLSVDTIVKLAEKNQNIVGVKESTGSIDVASEIIQRLGKKFFVISGDDSLTLPLMSVGATGIISVVANLVPRAVSEMCEAVLANDWNKAREHHLKLFPLVKAMFIETNPGPVKAAMKEAGLLDDESLRLPMVSV